MSLAQLNETVTVTGEAPFVDTSSSQVAGNVDRRQMESLPLQGRNWIELSNMVKGMTANNIVNTPGVGDDMFQLNLDGQQITQKIAGSGFGQPRFSREAIAEFQIVTNLFDITQGRSAGVQVQAISKSGTNTNSGSIYGFFRDDKLNAADKVANRVLPYSESAGRRHVRRADRARQDALLRVVRVRARAGHVLQQPVDAARANLHRAVQERAEEFPRARRQSAHHQQPPVGSRIALDVEQSLRARRQRSSIERLGADQGSQQRPRHVVACRLRAATRFTRSRSARTISTGPTRRCRRWRAFRSTISLGSRSARPTTSRSIPRQNNWESRYDLTWNKGKHDIKMGVEYVHVQHTGDWYIQSIGRYTMSSVPSNLGTADSGERRARSVAVEHRGPQPGRRRAWIATTRTAAGRTSSTRRGRPTRCGLATPGASAVASRSTTASATTRIRTWRQRRTSRRTRFSSTQA